MFGIARNELRAYYRSLKQQPDLVPIEQLQDLPFQIPSPEQQLQRKEAFIHLFHVLSKFPERERAIIGLRFGADLPLRQIASIMGLRENHVSVLLHRMMEKLKVCLKELTHEIN
jgi:RNA polymerase sigma factor (sigma-70 family)